MSKDINIQEAGLPKALAVDALRVKKQDGGSGDWVPADGKNLVELQIGGSGTYKASDYNAYGIAVARVTPKYGGGATSKAAEHDFTEKHTPSIKEGGKSRNFSAAMLKTNLQGGGTCLWIPRMNVELKNKYISKSGTYTAKADDCYGFDQVTVSNVDVEITQDDDGDDVERTTDGGEVTETKLPSYIRVTVLPEKIDYTVGETIDYTGLVVHAYTKSGIDMGVVPFNELILPVTTAGESAKYDYDKAGSDFDISPLPNPCPYAQGGFVNTHDYTSFPNKRYSSKYTFTPASGRLVRSFGRKLTEDDHLVRGFFATNESGPLGILNYWRVDLDTDVVVDDDNRFFNAYNSYTYNGRTVYYVDDSSNSIGYRADGTGDASVINVPDILWPNNSGVNQGELAWTLIYGTITTGGYIIPVQWHRPGDGELLETSFNIYTHSA